ncbi:MAG: T9SS type A sorting domain-containing protein [Ignavibacteriaceae bacterium]
MKIIIIFLIIAISPYLTFAKIFTVPGEFSKIQFAIYAAHDGDTVVVFPGTYHENIKFMGKKIVVTSRFYEKSDNSYILSTIIDGSTPTSPDTGSVVLFINNEDSTSVIQGFTLTGGSGTNWKDEHGAGVYREGGAVLSAFSAPTIKFNLMVNNIVAKNNKVQSAGGGAIRSGDGFPRILNNVIINNKGRYGGGIVLNYTNAIVRNNIIFQNSGGEDYGGGAIWVNRNLSSPKLIENNTIVGNSTTTTGAAYNDSYGTNTILRNNIFWGNIGPTNLQIYIKSGTANLSYCDIQGGYKGNGNINIDPQFSDSVFILKATSPCIDAGDSSLDLNDLQDSMNISKALWPSQGGLRNDMGAYGGRGSSTFPSFSAITRIIKESYKIPLMFDLFQNYPNPFNPSTIINYKLSTNGFVKLIIYDILGRELKTLVNEYKLAGDHSLVFNASGLNGGVYFYQLKVDQNSQTKKNGSSK